MSTPRLNRKALEARPYWQAKPKGCKLEESKGHVCFMDIPSSQRVVECFLRDGNLYMAAITKSNAKPRDDGYRYARWLCHDSYALKQLDSLHHYDPKADLEEV